MDNIKKLNLNDEALPLEDYPDSYLSTKKKDIDKHRESTKIFSEIFDMFRDLEWQDIKFENAGNEGGDKIEVPVLPPALRKKIRKAYGIDPRQTKDKFTKDNRSFAKTIDDHLNSDSNIYMKVENASGNHRSHFPNNGLPNALRGLGLGYKLYRALIEKHKYLSSDENGTTEKDRVWQSLISPKKDKRGRLTDDDVHSILGPNYVFAMIKNIPKAQKIEYAKQFIDRVVSDDDQDINRKNFGIDSELKAILPKSILTDIDPKAREEKRDELLKDRYAKFAPGGINNHSWDIGDYIVLKDYLTDPGNTEPQVVRKVVSKENGEWIALKLTDLANYERTGNLGDSRDTTSKSEWVKSRLQPGMQDPTAGRIPVKGGGTRNPAAPRVERRAGADQHAIRDFMRYGDDYDVYADKNEWRNTPQNDPITSFVVKKERDGRNMRYIVMNGSTGVKQTLSSAIFSRRFIKLKRDELSRKTDVEEGDRVFIRDHRTYIGMIASVYRITPAENRQPGIYLSVGENRPLYISDPSTLDKIKNATNESIQTTEHIKLFEEFSRDL